jgi:hypothetical protein
LEGKGLFSFEETRVCLGTQYYNTFLKKKVRKRKGSRNQGMVFYNV